MLVHRTIQLEDSGALSKVIHSIKTELVGTFFGKATSFSLMKNGLVFAAIGGFYLNKQLFILS